jgi:small subunit ribosomal protein S11
MAEKTATKTIKVAKVTKTKAKKSTLVVTEKGKVFISATFNNTLVTITNEKGETIGWSSAGAVGFKGTRKSTPFAASTAVENVAKRAVEKGVRTVEVFIKGPGAGRDSALRAIKAAGLSISMIADITPIPHNGPRASKKRRI